jgi:TrmH family RNA methyltransferase
VAGATLLSELAGGWTRVAWPEGCGAPGVRMPKCLLDRCFFKSTALLSGWQSIDAAAAAGVVKSKHTMCCPACTAADACPYGLEAVAVFIKPSTALPARLSSSNVITVTDAVMKKLTGLEETAGVQIAAELTMPPLIDLQEQQQQQQDQRQPASKPGPQQQQQQPVCLQRLLVLEGVQDPGNLGTLLRCAAAFGWDAVWLLPGCCDPFNDKALRASRGAGFKLPLAAGNLQQLLQVVEGRGMLLLAAEPDPDADCNTTTSPSSRSSSSSCCSSSNASAGGTPGGSITGVTNSPVALVLGSEGSGLSSEVLAVARPLAVPMVGDMESLNVGVAGSILMFCLSEGWPQLTARLQQLQLVP